MRSWTLEDLKSELSARRELTGWIVTRENVHRRERYFLSDGSAVAVDQDRDARIQSTSLRLMVELPGKQGRQGEVSKKLFSDRPLSPQLDAAVEAALQTDHQAWTLPSELPSNLPVLRTADPRIAEDLEGSVKLLSERIRSAVGRPSPAFFNSAELFVSLHERELHLSNGLKHRASQTRVYAEAAYSFTRREADGRTRSDEYMNTGWAVGLDQLPVEELFAETAERATLMLDTEMPKSGAYAVIVDSEVLSTVFHAVLGQFSGSSRYLGLPSVKAGDALVPELQSGADLLTLELDPGLELGADTGALSDTGVPQKRLVLVDQNRVLASAVDQQYATYLNEPATTVRGDLVVQVGTRSIDELRSAEDQVLEILQFSGLFVDGNSGTFSSEIRLARLHDRRTGDSRIIKGGSLSGNFRENFKGALLSKEKAHRAHFSTGGSTGSGYLGPKHALLSGVSIAGE